jgi:DNA-binding transcriptional LysR family regulator
MQDAPKCDLDLSALRALSALRDLASFTRVGEKVNLSSSAVFCQIRQLEDQLSDKLYERNGKWLRLTATGRLLTEHAEKIIGMHDAALGALRPDGSAKRELVRVGCGPHGSVEIVPYLLQALIQQQPRAEFRMISADDNSLLDDLRSGLLDAVFMSLPGQPNELGDLEQAPLWSYEFVLVLPSAASGLYPSPTLPGLRHAPFILYRRPMVIDSAFRQLAKDLQFEPNVVMENDEADSIKELVRLGLGISFLPYWHVADEARRRTLRILRPPEAQCYNYGLLYRRSAYEAGMLSRFLKVASEWKKWWPLAKHVSPPIAPQAVLASPQRSAARGRGRCGSTMTATEPPHGCERSDSASVPSCPSEARRERIP